MTVDPDGNILSAKPRYNLWRINYEDGTGMTRVAEPIPGYTSSLASVSANSLGEIFLTAVLPGYPGVILNPDFSLSATFADTIDGFGRTIQVSADGNDVYVPRFTEKATYVYHSDNGSLGPYVLADTIHQGLVVESMAWDPNGYLWVSSGYATSPPDPPYTPYSWYGYDVNTKTMVDSLKWNDVQDMTDTGPRPRGIAFSPTGDTVYIAEFNSSVTPCVQMFVRSVTSVERDDDAMPSGYTLSQNFPNPFNPTTQIRFTLGEAGHTTLKVYDVLGQEIATLVNERLSAGSYTARFDATNLPSGTYYYALTSGGHRLSRKMVLLK